MSKLYLSPSLIAKQQICEQQIYLEKVGKQKRVTTSQMISGLHGHRILEDEFKEEAVEVTVEEFIRDGGTSREFWIESSEFMMRGIIDEITILDDKVIIFDDKKNAKVYESYIKQLQAYALLVQGELVKDKPIYIAIRDLDSGEVIWYSKFEDDDKISILDTIKRVSGIIEGSVKPTSTKNPNICRRCSLECEFRLSEFNA